MGTQSRKPISIDRQIEVFFRDKWLCHICVRPIVFPLALRQLSELVEAAGGNPGLAYFDLNWRRDRAPLLDELGACIDHVAALARGGGDEIENLAAICARCNARKSALTREKFIQSSRPWKVKGKHGEPLEWDGLASVFVALAAKSARPLTATEAKWLVGLRARLNSSAG